jgi:hypothetical protein
MADHLKFTLYLRAYEVRELRERGVEDPVAWAKQVIQDALSEPGHTNQAHTARGTAEPDGPKAAPTSSGSPGSESAASSLAAGTVSSAEYEHIHRAFKPDFKKPSGPKKGRR